MTCFEHDGSYPGDVCASTSHPHHKGLQDSQWNQFHKITELYHWMRKKGIYLNVPDFYFLNGSTKTSIGYRETNWSLPRDRQLIHTRQLNYDCTWERIPSSLWSFVPLVEYHGGGAAATLEPLSEHLYEYKTLMVQITEQAYRPATVVRGCMIHRKRKRWSWMLSVGTKNTGTF